MDDCQRKMGGFQSREGKREGTGIALIIIGVEGALCDLDIVFPRESVEGMFASGEDLAGVTMAEGICRVSLVVSQRRV